MSKKRIAFIILILTSFTIINVAYALSLNWNWTLPDVPGNWPNGLAYSEARVDATCDGPHRVYIIRSGPTPTSNHTGIAVVPWGCTNVERRKVE